MGGRPGVVHFQFSNLCECGFLGLHSSVWSMFWFIFLFNYLVWLKNIQVCDVILCVCMSCRSSLWVDGWSLSVETVPQRGQVLYEHELSPWVHLHLSTCKYRSVWVYVWENRDFRVSGKCSSSLLLIFLLCFSLPSVYNTCFYISLFFCMVQKWLLL